MTYLRLTEHNDWEGETWDFFIQVDDNEEAIKVLREKITQSEDFVLGTDEMTDIEVDILVEKGNNESGYMARFNKVPGILDLDKIKEITFDPELGAGLYKGGIKDYIK